MDPNWAKRVLELRTQVFGDASVAGSAFTDLQARLEKEFRDQLPESSLSAILRLERSGAWVCCTATSNTDVVGCSIHWHGVQSDLPLLRRLPHLIRFDAIDCDDDTIHAISSILSLQCVKVSGIELTDRCVTYLKKFPHLVWLELTAHSITASAIDELRTGLPECTIRCKQ